MTDDIVTLLRDDYQKTPELCAEAAEEIEALRSKELYHLSLVERAVEAEQERCAKVAENHYKFPNEGPEIAAAIRKRTND